ncbi:MerR family transcriptional regulator [Brevibacillus brevis]|uniref:MerR family transcriptional regulator n=1 Tax=Brevibacillus brevis TaxID=1393 RepID=A0ABY9T6T9_BREBE|nr:MerR family transcriptional regulator [Brevibacillus brevis]WNC15817.1 MerR family transcriptional regulator [Brevibacillus brevis]
MTIQQMAKMTGLSVHTLRYYEKIGLLNGVERNEHGYRQYSEADLAWIHFLLRLRSTGMPVSDMKLFSDLRSQGNATVANRRELLENHHKNVLAQIQDLKESLREVEEKIDYYKRLEEQNEQ